MNKVFKWERFSSELELCKFVNNRNVEVVSVVAIEGGKSWVDSWTLFYYAQE